MVKVRLRPIVNNINMPTALKTAILPGETVERLFIATQIGEVIYVGNGTVRTFLDIRPQVIKLDDNDERGLIGLAFHPEFTNNGLFYLHYSVAGTQGPGAFSGSFRPDPCDEKTLNLKWEDRETKYNHIDTVEEWFLQPNGQSKKLRTLLNLRRPFRIHNGFNSLNFSPETGKLFLTTGDGGSAYDPFNLSQNNMEIAGKIIEIDVDKNVFNNNPPVVSRFDELPPSIQGTLTLIAKGTRNISGISFQRFYNQYIKYIGNVGQASIESIFAFVYYHPIPITQLVQASIVNLQPEGLINFGWRGWEGVLPTLITKDCSGNENSAEKVVAYYDEAIKTSDSRIQPLTSYFHNDPRPYKYEGSAITGVKPYLGVEIPSLTGNVVFTDLVEKNNSEAPNRGALAYTRFRTDGKLNDYSIIEVDYNFGSESAFYVGLGSNLDQTKLYLGVSSSRKSTDLNKGSIFEIIP